MLPFLTANRSPILMCRGPVRYTEPAGRPRTPRTKPKLFNQNQTPHLQTQKEKNCFFVAVVDALQKQKIKRGSHHRGTDVGPASHAPPLGIYTGPTMRTLTQCCVRPNSTEPSLSFSQKCPVFWCGGERVFSSSRSCQADRYARGKLGFRNL